MKDKSLIASLAATAALFTPLIASAQDLGGVMDTVRDLLDGVIPLLLGLAVIYFIWALIKYIGSAGDDSKKGEARSQMLYGIIIIAVMLGVWGLADILLETFGIRQVGPGQIPQIP